MSNKEKIKGVYKINDDLTLLLETESDLYKKATENRKDKMKITRGGKKIEVTEGELWDEIRVVGIDSETVKIMEKKYPTLFEVVKKRDAKNKELHDFIQKEFGFSHTEMTIPNYLKLTEAVIEYKLEERGSKNKK